jgi:ribokinase
MSNFKRQTLDIFMNKVITIGSVSQDVFFPTVDGVIFDTPEDVLSQKKIAFESGAKYHIEKRYESLGGCSVNVAVGLARLGEDVACYTTIGDDTTGEWILKELKKTAMNIDNVVFERNCDSDLSMIVVDKKSADRIIFSNQIANQKFVFDPKKVKQEVDWIFVGDLNGDWRNNLDKIISFAKEKKIKIAFNPRQKTIHEDVNKIIKTISDCELIFVNKDEATEIISSTVDKVKTDEKKLNDEKFLIKKMKEMGSKIVVLTDGIRGAWGFDGKELLYVPAVTQISAVDSTGAGDAFTSGFFAAHLKNKKLAECLKWGIANSSNSITEYGGQEGLLNEKEIEAMLSNISVKSIG